ncbi:MAG: hypothetical protein O3A01_00680 [bacterium]|nr:hypothetical protein [bacterium]
MMKSNNVTIISDDTNSLIDRKETQEKLTRLDIYIERVQSRVKQLQRQREAEINKKQEKELVQKGMELMNISTNLSAKR